MLEEAPAVELITEVLVKGVGIRAVVAAGDLDANAATRPTNLLASGNEKPTNAPLPILSGDNEAGDAA